MVWTPLRVGLWVAVSVAVAQPAQAQLGDLWRATQRLTVRAAAETRAVAVRVYDQVKARAQQASAGAKDAARAAKQVTAEADPRVVAYFAAKRSADQASAERPWRTLSTDLQARLRPLFKRIDLDRVRFRDGARTPATQWREGGASMTFGYDIYFGPLMPQELLDRFARGETRRGAVLFRLLVHELVHTDQVRRLGGEAAFARAYLDAWVLAGMSYVGNSFEVEAYTKQEGWLPPPPAKKAPAADEPAGDRRKR